MTPQITLHSTFEKSTINIYFSPKIYPYSALLRTLKRVEAPKGPAIHLTVRAVWGLIQDTEATFDGFNIEIDADEDGENTR